MLDEALEPNLSHFEIEWADGIKDQFLNQICYSELVCGINKLKGLRVFFPTPDECMEEYINYVISCDLFAGVIVPESASEAPYRAFSIRVDLPTNYVLMALSALRMAWEGHYEEYHGELIGFAYPFFRDKGFSEKQSLYLTLNFGVEHGYLVRPAVPDTHIPFPREMSWDRLHPCFFNSQLGLLSNGVENMGIYCGWRFEYASHHTNFDLFRNKFIAGNGMFDEAHIQHIKQLLKEE